MMAEFVLLAALWGAWLPNEQVTLWMLPCGAVIARTALSAGLLHLPERSKQR